VRREVPRSPLGCRDSDCHYAPAVGCAPVVHGTGAIRFVYRVLSCVLGAVVDAPPRDGASWAALSPA